MDGVNKIVIILVHGGLQCPESIKINKYLDSKGIDGITRIPITNKSTKQWLQHNYKGIKIERIPSFIISQTNGNTLVFPSEDIEEVLQYYNNLVLQ